MSSISNGLYFLTLPLVSVMRVIDRKIRHVRYLYIKRNVEKVWGARYTLGARYLSKNTVIPYAEEITGDHKCGFRHKISTTDHTFCILQVLEKNGNSTKQGYSSF